MKYTIYLTDFRNFIWREFINNEDDNYDRDKRKQWLGNFYNNGGLRHLMFKDENYISDYLTNKIKEYGLNLSDTYDDEYKGITNIKNKLLYASYESSLCNDPDIIGSEILDKCGYELVLYKDYIWSPNTKTDNFNVTLEMYVDNVGNLGIYWQNRRNFNFKYQTAEEMLESFRNSIEENKGKNERWGDFHIDMTSNSIKYYGSKKKAWEIPKEDVEQFWYFLKKYLPTLIEKRELKLKRIIN